MTELEYVPIPIYSDNYAWLITDGCSAIVVDPGDTAPVIRYCDENGLRLTGVLVTHHHSDHTGGIEALLSWSGDYAIPVYGLAKAFIPGVSARAGHGFRLTYSEPAFEASIIAIPGHTQDHIAYFEDARGTGVTHLFCGDALFASGCGRLLEGTAEQMLASLDGLAVLPRDTKVHCAHEYTLANIQFARHCEPSNTETNLWYQRARALRYDGLPTLPTSIELELAVNPFLRLQNPEFLGTLEDRFRVAIPNRLAAFTPLRGWKDIFRADESVPTERLWSTPVLANSRSA
ncbi:hydroxyacylglutathione hydrolase [Paraburkholderia unamae]|uniref:Hydroxyacylglutathione hydrolase n=1 Tax=Paraburkholderia unamae TaxID=219649 RepID=A0ABX5KKP2_9BURK|nr:hydroxyacylglutathione hydrolase [Paraburkholderia unamae]PVX82431.1 hydroxyacylglutathione hydrolase [Paraburkholderia unamae]